MRKLMMAVAATAILTSAALFGGARPADAQAMPRDALKTAFENGDLPVSYVQRRGGGRGAVAHRGGGGRGAVAYRGGGGRGAVAYRGAGGRGAVAYRGAGGRGGVAYRGGYRGPVYAGRPYYRGGYYGRPYYGGYGYNYGGAAAAGAIGLATGAIVGSAIAQQPVYAAPGGRSAAYCAQRYKSYDVRSGTYLGYDGLRHPCP